MTVSGFISWVGKLHEYTTEAPSTYGAEPWIKLLPSEGAVGANDMLQSAKVKMVFLDKYANAVVSIRVKIN